MKQKVADYDQFQVRLPAGMRDRIRAAAEGNNRSMNAEVVATLEAVYGLPDVIDALLDEVNELVAKHRNGEASPNEYKKIRDYAVSLEHHLSKLHDNQSSE